MEPRTDSPEAVLRDEELVARTLGGDRDAFRRIVERYQTLICSIAYSGTGDLAHSEDVAQETFIAGWKQLQQLREPARLRAWLCGIAHNLINNRRRRLATEPSHAGTELTNETAADDAPPSELAVKREQEAILWQALQRIPADYRQPLVLFYREHRSIERVARDLDLSEDAVRQRLSRGRKLLHHQVTAFVEGTLAQTAPGPVFTAAVIGALPLLTTSGLATAATAGGSIAKWGAAGLGTKLVVVLNLVIGPLLGLVAAWLGVRASLDATETPAERAQVKCYLLVIALTVVVFGVTCGLLTAAVKTNVAARPALIIAWIALGIVEIAWVAFYAFRTKRILRGLRRSERQQYAAAFGRSEERSARASRNYRSEAAFLGLPLVHIRYGAAPDARDHAAVGWIAIGDYAVGVALAVGGIAIGGVAIGGLSLGIVAIGGASLAVLALGGLAIGAFALGGAAVGVVATGGVALGWIAAQGAYAVAREFVVASYGSAPHANDAVAQTWFAARPWFDLRTTVGKAVLSLVWLPALVVIWETLRQRRHLQAPASSR